MTDDTLPPGGRVTRRRVLVWSGVTLLMSGGGFAVYGKKKLGEIEPLLAEEYLPADGPTGAVAPDVARNLIAATDKIIGMRFTPDVYADYFAWRAAHLPGYSDLYRRFSGRLDEIARSLGAEQFAAASHEVRDLSVQRLLPILSKRGKAGLASGLLFAGRDDVLFFRYVVIETLNLFSATDAYVHLGYDAWPGVARGLVYQSPIPNRAR